jgi:hypothetical protein
MDRRDFLKSSLFACGGVALGTGLKGKAIPRLDPEWKLRVQYIRQASLSFQIPPYRGERYEDNVPDTLDIAERAKLGINVLTSITDPAADYEIYWLADFLRNPPVMLHDFNDWCQNVEGLEEALPLLRTITGESTNSHVDRTWMETTLKSVGPDGLIYIPMNGRPWARHNAVGIDPVWKSDGSITRSDASVSQFANACTCQRTIGAMTLYYLRDRNPMWKTTIEKMVQRLAELSIDHGDFCYFAMGSFEPNGRPGTNALMPVGSDWGNSLNGRLLQGAAQYCRVSGYEPPHDLLRKLANYTRYHAQAYDPESGAWLLDPELQGQKLWLGKFDVRGLRLGGHAAGHGVGLLSLLEYAITFNDHDALEFVKDSFVWARDQRAAFGISSLVGWFPEFYVPGYPSCEGCIVGYMLSMALKLSVAGGDYWDDIDRWVRNQFAVQQLTSVDWIYREASQRPCKAVGPFETAERTPERNVGGFGGWASGNDWAVTTGIPHCCTGNCTRALYYVWEHIIERKGERLRVNLLLNRASRWADVYSYVPYEGRVDVKMREECGSVLLRAPEWVLSGSPEVRCTVNKMPRDLNWEGRYVDAGAVKPGDTISATFPIPERRVKERIGPVTYTLTLRGNTVVSIDPQGQNGPLYADRAKYQASEVKWRRVQRFVSEEEIVW